MADFSDEIMKRLDEAGLRGASLVSARPVAASFGNTEAIFQMGSLLLRFVSDRGQTHMDVAAVSVPTGFHQFGDVEIAMGWKTIDQVLAMREPEDLTVVLVRLRANLDTLIDAFSGPRERLTRGLVERARQERGREFSDRLRRKK